VDSFVKVFHRISSVGAVIGACFLSGIMLVVIASIIVRPFGETVPGSYEMIELLIVVTIAFAYAYTTLKQGHISVGLLVSRFKPRTQGIISSLTWLISLATWGLIVWASTDLMFDRWTRELTEFLEIPFLPFRLVWSFGLLLFCVALALELYNSIKQALKP
jgi:TRAP-type C4-dicarboxylate transport system permease small subunit